MNEKEKEEIIISTTKEYNVSIKDIKIIPYTVVSFVGIDDNKTLRIAFPKVIPKPLSSGSTENLA